MSLEDFCRNFHELNVCRNVNNPLFGHKELESVVGCWTVNDDPLMNRSGGCYNNRDTFLQNPQVWTKFFLSSSYQGNRAFLVAQTVKNLPAVQETWVWFLGQEDPLEKGMATQFSILAWRIPWTEELSGLQSMGSQRVRHYWVTNTYNTNTDTI